MCPWERRRPRRPGGGERAVESLGLSPGQRRTASGRGHPGGGRSRPASPHLQLRAASPPLRSHLRRGRTGISWSGGPGRPRRSRPGTEPRGRRLVRRRSRPPSPAAAPAPLRCRMRRPRPAGAGSSPGKRARPSGKAGRRLRRPCRRRRRATPGRPPLPGNGPRARSSIASGARIARGARTLSGPPPRAPKTSSQAQRAVVPQPRATPWGPEPDLRAEIPPTRVRPRQPTQGVALG